jgi:AcrR family transcriptional regulator
MSAKSTAKPRRDESDETPARQRILDAAFSAFMERGFAETSTLEIATRARVSKRELYALVGSKQEMLAACIGERAKRLQMPAGLPEPHDRGSLARALEMLGTQLLREISDPTVIAVFRLAMAEAVRTPEVAQTLNSLGVEPSRAVLRDLMNRSRSVGLLSGDPAEMAEHFVGLLWGNLMTGLLLRTTDRPTAREIARRANQAAAGLLQLHAPPDEAATT